MEKLLSKRRFLGYMAAVPAGFAALRLMGADGFIPSAQAAAPNAAKTTSGPFTLPPLPYPANALEKAIDAKTMEIHHGKHHQAYVDKLNEEVAKDAALAGLTMEQILASVSKFSPAVRNNGGGHWNHTFFWSLMTPQKTEASPALSDAITKSFGSMEAFRKKFEEAGLKQFGSGWAWLIVNEKGALEVTATPNQDNPLMDDAKVKGTPILGNDVWEHAYYLRYQNKRADYLKTWWNVVNWAKVSELYAAALK
jgi:Fe-Mn family superoxide dismutase